MGRLAEQASSAEETSSVAHNDVPPARKERNYEKYEHLRNISCNAQTPVNTTKLQEFVQWNGALASADGRVLPRICPRYLGYLERLEPAEENHTWRDEAPQEL